MSKGGSQTSTTQLPEWLEQPARRNIARAEEISQIGYMPNLGPQVAAFTNPQYQAMANNNRLAQAYGMQTQAIDVPDAQTFAGGLQGYNSWAPAEEGIRNLQRNRPHQYNAVMGQFLNPWTGALPASQAAASETQSVDPQTGQYTDFNPYWNQGGR